MLEFVSKAAESGFDAIKIQYFEVEELFSPEILRDSEEHRSRKNWELDRSLIPDLARETRRAGLKFGATVFSLESAKWLGDFVDFFKIASYELLWTRLLREVGGHGIPVIVSTGMAELSEILDAESVLREAGCQDYAFLHCVSAYPTPAHQSNLAAISTIRNAVQCRVGWSDHSRDPSVISRAVHHWGAEIVEMHLDLDGRGFEFFPGHSWLPGEAQTVIQEVRRGFSADGHGQKKPMPLEEVDVLWRADPEDGFRPLRSIRNKPRQNPTE